MPHLPLNFFLKEYQNLLSSFVKNSSFFNSIGLGSLYTYNKHQGLSFMIFSFYENHVGQASPTFFWTGSYFLITNQCEGTLQLLGPFVTIKFVHQRRHSAWTYTLPSYLTYMEVFYKKRSTPVLLSRLCQSRTGLSAKKF